MLLPHKVECLNHQIRMPQMSRERPALTPTQSQVLVLVRCETSNNYLAFQARMTSCILALLALSLGRFPKLRLEVLRRRCRAGAAS